MSTDNDSGRQPAAEDLAGIAVKEAERARNNGTFGVGGLLVDGSGITCKVIGNGVIQDNSVYDPTAHVERQLVDWYFSNRRTKSLPPSNKMTIITSLDPCVMCSGAILAGGLDVIRVSQDSKAGVSCRGPGNFSTLPGSLRDSVKETFSAFGIVGKRPFNGSPRSLFFGKEIDSKLDERSVLAFSSNLKKVIKIVNGHHEVPLDELINPLTLVRGRSSSHISNMLKKYNPKIFSKEYAASSEDRLGIDLGHILIQKARESYSLAGVFNSACIVDPFGNVLLAEGGAEHESPIRTPFMELIRRYHRLLFEAGQEGEKYFAHPKYCTVLLLLGPGQDSKSLMDVGAFGSSMQGKLPKGKRGRQLQYVIPRQKRDDMEEMLDNLPPLYSDVIRVRDAIQEVEDPRLQEYCIGNAMKYISGC